jgi:homoserine dehydrogenase
MSGVAPSSVAVSASLSQNGCLAPGAARKTIGVALLGFGTVGQGVYQLLSRHSGLKLLGIGVRQLDKERPELEARLAATGDAALKQYKTYLTTELESLLAHPELDVLVEVAGGVETAAYWVEEALKRGKSVVTANKELIAKKGNALAALARQHGGALLFEAAVAGGIPILLPLKQCLAANQVKQIAGILNGTTNYILTRMMQDGWDFKEALAQAQARGFAEADPSSDVEGYDAAYKISILAALAFGQFVDVSRVYVEGITNITAIDIENARRLGFTIRLLGLARQSSPGEPLDVRVHPMLVENTHPLASIHNEYNAVWVDGDAVGDCMFYGRGAGMFPTASAVCGDLFALAQDLSAGNMPQTAMQVSWEQTAELKPLKAVESRFYIRLSTKDLPGVIGELGKFGISLESVLQQPVQQDKPASILLITHSVSEQAMRQTLEKIAMQETTKSIDCVLRVL